MNNNQLCKLVDNLKNKIKKIENNNSNKHNILTYQLSYPDIIKNNKKYTSLLFEDINNNMKNTSFVKLYNKNIIINLSLTLKIIQSKNDNSINNVCYVCIGIREDNDKIKIIKGGKFQFDTSKHVLDNHIYINNTLLYDATIGQELCIITSFNKKCNIVSKKSILKILHI